MSGKLAETVRAFLDDVEALTKQRFIGRAVDEVCRNIGNAPREN